jgi:hypothetical protein
MKAMTRNIATTKRLGWRWLGKWVEDHKMKVMVGSNVTFKDKQWQPGGWKEDHIYQKQWQRTPQQVKDIDEDD